MYREIVKDLMKWRNSDKRKPLVITGMRQCGKTYVMQKFGKEAFESVVYINLEKNELAASIFEYDYDVHRIVNELSGFSEDGKIIPGKSLLIIDEIQACPRAITALKYFCEDMRELHVMCAGSLLGVALKHENISFPVGKINRLQMYPMSFKEYLIACDEENIVKILNDYAKDRPLADSLMGRMEKLLKNYLLVGGMPEAVASWCENRSFEEVAEIQDNILEDYSSDFSKHAPIADVPKLHWIWESVPKQLAKENNKFVFSQVKSGKRAHELENALQWLVDSGLVYRCELAANPEIPLSFSADGSYFKIYMADVGLLCRRTGLSYKALLAENGVFSSFKGALTENYVHNELIYLDKKPYFWRSGNTAEVDFLIEDDENVIPVEVKSADNTRAKSYRLFCNRHKPSVGYKFSLKNTGVNMTEQTETYNIPLYMIWTLH